MTRQPHRRGTAVTAVSRAAIACPLGSCRVLVAPATGWPLGLDARVTEQDTWFLLGAHDALEPGPASDSGAAIAGMGAQQPGVPGHLYRAPGRPGEVVAVVYDVEADPVTRTEWLCEAWHALAARARRHGYRSMAAPLLGAAHSRLAVEELVFALREGWRDTPPPGLERFWLLVPPRMSATSVARRLAA